MTILTEKERKRKLSFQGIFLIYNYREILRYPPYWLSILVCLSYFSFSILQGLNQRSILDFLLSKIDSLFPNLLGFSLGGYAIIIAFGNTEFLKRIAANRLKKKFTFYEKLNAIFAFSILLQVIVLFLSFSAEFFETIGQVSHINFAHRTNQCINLSVNLILIFFMSWALFLIPYVVSNLFIFGETHHDLLGAEKPQNPPPEEKNPPNKS